MQSYTHKLLVQLNQQLTTISQEQDVVLYRALLSFNACKGIIEQLKTFILKYKFKNESEEIRFFKEIKPSFTSKLNFHLMVYNIETRKPNGGREIVKRYLSKELDRLKSYFDYNIDFYKYYRAGSTILDKMYFIRDKFDIQLNPDGIIFENDPRFCTTHDFKVAKILAHDQLQVYIEKELASLDNLEIPTSLPYYPKAKLIWSDTKTALIELIYALHAQSSFNGGKADIKEIAAYFEAVFSIELGDYYHTYLEIRNRKTGRSKFLDTITQALLRRMDSNDEK